MKRPDQPQPLTLTEAIIPVGSLIALVALSYFLFGDAGALGPNQVALMVAAMLALFIGWRRGHSLESLGKAATESVATGIGAIFILFAVGALIGTWAMSGTLVAMVYYGLQLLSPNYFYLTACAICGIVSASIGSSWTVVGTIGVGFMGIAVNMGLNPAIAAGAVISGAYFGDKSSPLSDSANLAAAAAGVGLYAHLRETAADLAGGTGDRPGRVLPAGRSPATTTRPPSWTRIRSRVSHLPGAVPAARGGRRARPVQGTAVHRDLPRRDRRRRARRDHGARARDQRMPTPAICLRGWRCSRASGWRWRAGTRRPRASRRWTCWRPAAAWTAC